MVSAQRTVWRRQPLPWVKKTMKLSALIGGAKFDFSKLLTGAALAKGRVGRNDHSAREQYLAASLATVPAPRKAILVWMARSTRTLVTVDSLWRVRQSQ